MVLTDFNQLRAMAKNNRPKTVALVSAEDEHSLEAVFRVAEEGLVKPVLIGNKKEIIKNAVALGLNASESEIFQAEDPKAAAEMGVRLIKEKRADFLMKGRLETAELLKPVVAKESGLYQNGVMSHIALNQIPAYHKLLITTDGGMLPYPTLEQKKEIIINAVTVLAQLGYSCPKVCVLAAVEKANPKMPETLDGAALKEMNKTGLIQGCIVEGPISLDLALVKNRAEEKGYESPCAGDADILVVPNIQAGNILGKSIVELAQGKMAGLVMGALCPIVLTSRGSSAEEKFNALLLAALVSKKEG